MHRNAQPVDLRLQQFEAAVQNRFQIAGAQVGNPGPGEVQKFRDLLIEPVGLFHDDLGQAVLRLILAQTLLQELRRGADDPQGVADLVGHPRGHFPQGGQALGLVQLGLQVPLLLLAAFQDAPRLLDDLPEHDKQQTHDHHQGGEDDEPVIADFRQVSGNILGNLEDAHHRARMGNQLLLQAEGDVGLEVLFLSAAGPKDAPEGVVAWELKVVFSGQGFSHPRNIIAFLPQGQTGGAVGKHPLLVILVQLLHVKAVDGVAHHHIQAASLLRVRQGDAAALFIGGGQEELLINLMVQVSRQEQEVVFIFFQGHLLGPQGEEHRQDAGEDQNNNKPGQRKELDQPKGVKVLPRTPPGNFKI